ncbi:MAG: TonB-dependent receptor, partial [Oceanococcaceae bacterium]
GALDAQFAVGRPVGRNGQFNGAAQFYGTEGFREQSRARRGVLAGRYATTLGERWDLAVSTRWFEGEADSAAYVPLALFAVDPYGIDPRTLNDGSDKRFATLRVDAGTNVGRDLRLLTFAYTTQQDFTRWFTRGPQDPAAAWRQREESYDRTVFGLGTSLNGRQTMAGREVDFVLGIEGFDESTDEQFFDDLDNRVRTSPSQRDREATLESVSAFAEASIALAPRWQASAGLRYDRFRGDCRLLGPETGSDPCDTLDSIDNFSPKLGLKWQATDALALRASVAEGFALATGFAKFAPGAQALDPNTLRQFELGLAARAGRFDLDLALYQIDSSQEIGQPAPGEFENFGATERQGLELSTGWQLLPTLGLRAIFGRTDSEITRNRNADLLGNRVSGVPDETLTLLAEWAPAAQPLSMTAIYRHVGAYQLNAANSDAAPSYRVVDLIAQYRLPGDRERRLQLLIDNIFDEVYATTINSLGAAPGAPLTLRLGLKFDL